MLGIGAVAIAYGQATLQHVLSDANPREMPISITSACIGLSLLAVALVIRFQVSDPLAPRNRFAVFDLFMMLVVILSLLPVLPILIAGSANYFSIEILDPGCANPSMKSVTWLVIDSLAKGGLLDLMESFHVDLYTCPPNRDSLAVSCIVFALRCFSTYVIVWFVIKLWRYLRPRERRAVRR
jgi:hypothetical protein